MKQFLARSINTENNMVVQVIRSILVLCAYQKLSKVVAFPAEVEKDLELKDLTEAPKDLFRIQEEAKVLLERDPKLKAQFVAIIHNKFPHPTFPGARSPWFQVYVYSDYFEDMPEEEVSVTNSTHFTLSFTRYI